MTAEAGTMTRDELSEGALRVHLGCILVGGMVAGFSATALLLAVCGERMLIHPYLSIVVGVEGLAAARIAWVSLVTLARRAR